MIHLVYYKDRGILEIKTWERKGINFTEIICNSLDLRVYRSINIFWKLSQILLVCGLKTLLKAPVKHQYL